MNQREFESRIRTVETRLKPPRKMYVSIGLHHAAMLEAGGEQAARLHSAISELCGGGGVKVYLLHRTGKSLARTIGAGSVPTSNDWMKS